MQLLEYGQLADSTCSVLTYLFIRNETHVVTEAVDVVSVGIITTVKRRQEFRIRLQRRARRRVEKLLEGAEDERQRQIVCILPIY